MKQSFILCFFKYFNKIYHSVHMRIGFLWYRMLAFTYKIPVVYLTFGDIHYFRTNTNKRSFI